MTSEFGSVITEWALTERSIDGLALIGSRERSVSDEIWRADAESDWDFHLITSQPKMFLDGRWTRHLKGVDFRVYAARATRIGNVPKVNAVLVGTEVDIVVLPSRLLRIARMLTKFGWHRRPGRIRQFLQDLAVVVRPGFRFLKDTSNWNGFYRFAVEAIVDARISNDAARKIADGFVCDYVWAIRKLNRGELFAAQRMLHRELIETNFRLLHELKLRRGERSFPEARRIERIAHANELVWLETQSLLNRDALLAAIDKNAQTCRELMKQLVGNQWSWPSLR